MNEISEKAVWDELVSSEDENVSPTLHEQPAQPQMMFCYKCNQVIPANSAFCPWCQTELFVTCPKCGNKYSSQYPACNQCGTNLSEYHKQQSIRELQYKKQQDELERSLPKILKLSCSPWQDESDWGIKLIWETINVESCHISIRKKGDNTYYPIGYSYYFPSNGSVIVASKYFIEMFNVLSFLKNNFVYIVELTAANSDSTYVVHKEVEIKAYFPFYGFPTFYID